MVKIIMVMWTVNDDFNDHGDDWFDLCNVVEKRQQWSKRESRDKDGDEPELKKSQISKIVMFQIELGLYPAIENLFRNPQVLSMRMQYLYDHFKVLVKKWHLVPSLELVVLFPPSRMKYFQIS